MDRLLLRASRFSFILFTLSRYYMQITWKFQHFGCRHRVFPCIISPCKIFAKRVTAVKEQARQNQNRIGNFPFSFYEIPNTATTESSFRIICLVINTNQFTTLNWYGPFWMIAHKLSNMSILLLRQLLSTIRLDARAAEQLATLTNSRSLKYRSSQLICLHVNIKVN